MRVIYDFQNSPNTCLATTSHATINALLYLAKIVSAALTGKPLADPDKGRENLNNVSKEISSKCSLMNQNVCSPGVDKS